jgi:phosphoribosylformylglycinamidine synthase
METMSNFKMTNQNKYQAKIYVTLRPSVLDPAGTAVRTGLEHMGYANVENVRIGKYVEVSLTAIDEETAKKQLDEMCDQLLANPVIENYRFELTTV